MTDQPQKRTIEAGASAQALSHFYRGELGSWDASCLRAETTTCWAIGTTACLIGFGLAGDGVPTLILFPVAAAFLLVFLSVEARRWRDSRVSMARVRAMEESFLSPVLSQEGIDQTVLANLGRAIANHEAEGRLTDAAARRLWRVYAWLFLALYIAWFAQVWNLPTGARNASRIIALLRVGPLPGSALLACAGALLAWIAIQTIRGYRLTRQDRTRQTHAGR